MFILTIYPKKSPPTRSENSCIYMETSIMIHIVVSGGLPTDTLFTQPRKTPACDIDDSSPDFRISV